MLGRLGCRRPTGTSLIPKVQDGSIRIPGSRIKGTNKREAALLSDVPGTGYLALLVQDVAYIPLATAKSHSHIWLKGKLGNEIFILSGPICPATNSVTTGRGESGYWNISSHFCHTTLPIALCLVQSTDSFLYSFNSSILSKCLLN